MSLSVIRTLEFRIQRLGWFARGGTRSFSVARTAPTSLMQRFHPTRPSVLRAASGNSALTLLYRKRTSRSALAGPASPPAPRGASPASSGTALTGAFRLPATAGTSASCRSANSRTRKWGHIVAISSGSASIPEPVICHGTDASTATRLVQSGPRAHAPKRTALADAGSFRQPGLSVQSRPGVRYRCGVSTARAHCPCAPPLAI